MNPLVSIIIPIYNSSEWIGKCLNSILTQRYDVYEIILIDDGSTDGSSEICQRYTCDDRVRYYRQTNGGVSNARNTGIECANGEWICFIDSDDWIDEEFLIKLVKESCCCTETDMIISGLIYSYADGTNYKEFPRAGCFDLTTQQGLYTVLQLNLITSPVAKLYRRDIIHRYGIRFDNAIAYGEDRDFNLRFISHARYVVSCEMCHYFYRRDIPTSLSANHQIKKFAIDIKYWNNIYNLLSCRYNLNFEINSYLAYRLFHFINDELVVSHDASIIAEPINFQFLRDNISCIKYNVIIKWFVAHGLFKPIALFYKIRNKI